MANGSILDALAPLPQATSFPYPTVFQQSGPGSPSVTYEGPTINGIPMPGQWLLKRSVREFGWQQQQANFMSGAYLVPKGDPLMEIEYEIRIWESGAMAVFLGLLQTLLKKPAIVVPGGVGVAAALGINDAILKSECVASVVVARVQPPLNPLVSSGGKGCWVGFVHFLEYRSPIPALPVPDQTIPDPGAVTPSAASNQATASAAVTAGDNARQAAAATALVPPP